MFYFHNNFAENFFLYKFKLYWAIKFSYKWCLKQKPEALLKKIHNSW